ncbi:carbohydrate ABC transporter permease [Paenibacillus sp. GCM10023248]|uniref:carbohydrate ABC transporter permease n=1 Tax=unclassified Paenibacillus TaxID=185978 RepID=UPI0023792A93|nr:sugar ABC transporter permease [Paenibacillus sp. MAHUQ-63]MDD9269200.1 sugar ABC transporter permease [Paenibacillus sp. MAHUQ-63]
MENVISAPEQHRSVPRTRSKRRRAIQLWCLLFIAPNLIFYAMFQGWPILINWYYALHDWSGLSSDMPFVGLQNFKEITQDLYFWKAYANSFKFMFGSVPLLLLLALFLALVLNNPRLRGATIYRTLYFIPVVTTASIVGIIMVYIWGSDGAVNALLTALGIIDQPINWLGDAKWAMTTVIMIYVWKNLGMNMIYWLAGLQTVPRELYEAARVDGAGHLHTFFSITLPQIIPIGLVILLLNIAGSLKVFDLIKTMTEGGPFYATDVVSTYIYRYAFSSEMGLPRMGYASAAGILFAFTIIVVAVIQSWVNSRLKNSSRGERL